MAGNVLLRRRKPVLRHARWKTRQGGTREALMEQRVLQRLNLQIGMLLQESEGSEKNPGKNDKMLGKRGLIRLLNERIMANLEEANRLSEGPIGQKELDRLLQENEKQRNELERLKEAVSATLPEW